MKKFYEVLFQDGMITPKEWETFIHEVSKTQGSFHSWKFYLSVHNHEIHFYVKVKYPLFPCISHLPKFCFWEHALLRENSFHFRKGVLLQDHINFLELYDLYQTRKKKVIAGVSILFCAYGKGKTYHFAKLYYKKQDALYASRLFLSSVSSFLSFPMDQTNRFVFQKIPKYLNVQKHLNFFQKNKKGALLEVEAFPYLQHKTYLSLSQFDFDKHSFILGGSGTGKSKFLSSFVYELFCHKEYQKKYKVVFIDPHAAMEKDIGGLPHSCVIDFQSEESSIDLFANYGGELASSVENYLSLFETMMKEKYNSKLERVFRFSLELLLGMKCFTFQNLRNLLLDTDFRTNMLEKARDVVPLRVVSFFLQDFYELKTKSYGEAIAPIVAFLDEMQSLPVFQNAAAKKSLKDSIQNHFLLLFSLSKSKMGDHITKTIAGFLMCELLDLIVSHPFSEHLIFIVDEVAVIENPILCRFLSEARKYHLSIFLVSQYFNQISNSLKDAVLANTVNYYLFRCSAWDADLLVDSLNLSIPLKDTREEKMKMMTGLNHREGILRIQKNGKLLSGMKVKTLDFKPIPYLRERKQKQRIEEGKEKMVFSFVMDHAMHLKDFLKTVSTSHRKVRD